MATKDAVTESDLDAALKEKVNAASDGNHSHNNKTTLDNITEEKVREWDSKADGEHNHNGTYIKQTEFDGAVNTALQTAKDSGEFDGEDGADGGHYTPSVKDNGNGTMTVTFTASKSDMSDVSPVTISLPVPNNGKDGDDGEDGGYYTPSVNTISNNEFKISFTASKPGMPSVADVTITLPAANDGDDGVGIESVVQTTFSSVDGGENVITVTLTNGNETTFKVKNGSKGSKGDAGNGIKSIVKTSTSGLVDTYTITFTDNTTTTFTVTNGKAGTNGTSVTVSKVTESTESGGENVVEFSDGKSLTVKNGNDGQDGKDGASPTVTVNKSGKITTIQVVNADGTVSTSTVNDGSDGKDGEDGYAQMIPLEAESTDWLLENGDTTKQYLLPDGFFYKYEETTTTVPGTPGTTEPLFTNILSLAVDANGNDYVGANGEDGYKTGTRLNSSKVEKDDHDDMCCTGFVPIDPTDGKYILRIKGIKFQGSVGGYFYLFGDDRATGHGSATAMTTDFTAGYDSASDTYTLDLSKVSGLAEYRLAYYFRLSCGGITDDTIMTWNEEIEYKTTGATEPTETITKAWVSTGRAFIPADYEEEILDHETRITALENNGVGGGTTPGATLTDAEKLARIATWDKPIFDELEPYLVPTGEEMTVPAEAVKGWNSSTDPNNTYRKAQVQMVYDTYTELCETYPEYVREITDADNGIGGLCSDGEQMVRVYEFCELDGRHYNAAHTKKSETKLTIIVSAGIHKEWGGLYGVTKALTRIAEDPKLRYLRRNCRFIVVPVLNPYCFLDYNATSGVKNYNGVNIHVAFDDVLAEIEAQYLDNIFKKYSDAAFYLSCHSAQIDTTYGVAFVWPSAGSYYTCNLGFRIIDMMSFAWEQKYGTETWRNKVAAQNNKTDANGARLYTALPAGDYRVGHASISNTLNSEYKHALKYGIQGMNVEVIDTFHVLSSVGLDSYAITHGAEMYINLFRLAARNFNITDKSAQYE